MRPAHRFGRLLLTTTHQASNGPRVDAATVTDADGRRYQAVVFGTGHHAPTIGWRSTGPMPVRFWTWPARAPRPLHRPAVFLFAGRWSR